LICLCWLLTCECLVIQAQHSLHCCHNTDLSCGYRSARLALLGLPTSMWLRVPALIFGLSFWGSSSSDSLLLAVSAQQELFSLPPFLTPMPCPILSMCSRACAKGHHGNHTCTLFSPATFVVPV